MALETNYMLIVKEPDMNKIKQKIMDMLNQVSNQMYKNFDSGLSLKALSDPNMDKYIYKMWVNFGEGVDEGDLKQIKREFELSVAEECRSGTIFITVFEYEGEFKLVNII
ncbi:MAG: hypothetical protein PHD29_08970 [bacterium]|nr:hypothetical protein [bacterium]MDD5354116.1 hypothetical protein [bacterium]MDD5756912.1 hypothetical protein [bacterium]